MDEIYVSKLITIWIGIIVAITSVIASQDNTIAIFQIGPNEQLIIFGIVIDSRYLQYDRDNLPEILRAIVCLYNIQLVGFFHVYEYSNVTNRHVVGGNNCRIDNEYHSNV